MTGFRWDIDRIRAALEASGDLAYEWNLLTDGIDWFDGTTAAFGLMSIEPVATGAGFTERIHPEDQGERRRTLNQIAAGVTDYECEFRVCGGDGQYHWFHDRGTIDYTHDGVPALLRGVLHPFRAERRSARRLDETANLDALTGHFNRIRLREALDHALDYAHRFRVGGAYMVIGIDKMTMVNQAFGHEIADSVIVAIGDRLERCLRTGDVVGRVDGDSFGVVLANCPGGELTRAAEKILDMARNTVVDTPAGPIHVTVSIGAVSFPDTVRSAHEAMTKADVALRDAKQGGRDSFFRYSTTEAEQMDKQKSMVVAQRVQQALREDRLVFAFQPVVESQTLAPRFHECLLRLSEPGREVTAAGQFMPVVEALGMIRPIDRRTLEMAVDLLEGEKTARLAINVSGLTATDHSWLRSTVALLKNRSEIAERIIVEITETASLEDLDACARFVARLRDLGCQVALDDFGAGYTSFRHLKKLAVNIVKIDGSFIRNLTESEDNLVFVRTLLDLANRFSLTTVAECVETMEEVRILRREGVHMLQGNALGIPDLAAPWLSVPKAGEALSPAPDAAPGAPLIRSATR